MLELLALRVLHDRLRLTRPARARCAARTSRSPPPPRSAKRSSARTFASPRSARRPARGTARSPSRLLPESLSVQRGSETTRLGRHRRLMLGLSSRHGPLPRRYAYEPQASRKRSRDACERSRGEIHNSPAFSAFVLPAATSSRISLCRGLSRSASLRQFSPGGRVTTESFEVRKQYVEYRAVALAEVSP